ncbi:MAG: hypothetical protein Q4C30_04420 [Bacteroidia bacterium]|nr:hypothetical protein [Bacteroidia bacterium]
MIAYTTHVSAISYTSGLSITSSCVLSEDLIVTGDLVIEREACLVFNADATIHVYGNVINRGTIKTSDGALIAISVIGDFCNRGVVVTNDLFVSGILDISAGSFSVPILKFGISDGSGIGKFKQSGGDVSVFSVEAIENTTAYIDGGSISISSSNNENFTNSISLNASANLSFRGGQFLITDCDSVCINADFLYSLKLNNSYVSSLNDNLYIGSIMLENNSTLLLAGDIDIHGSIYVDNSSSFLSVKPAFRTTFSGDLDVFYRVYGKSAFHNVDIKKTKGATLTIDDESSLDFTGSFSADEGVVVGDVKFCGNTKQNISVIDADLKGLNLRLKSKNGVLSLKSDLHIKSLSFEEERSYINPERFVLSVDDDIIFNKSNFYSPFYSGIQVNAYEPAPSVRVPIRKGFMVPFLYNKKPYHIYIDYDVEGVTCNISFVPHIHRTFLAEYETKNKWYYWRISTDSDVGITPNQQTYTCKSDAMISGDEALVYTDDDWIASGEVVDGSCTYKGITQGDFYFGKNPMLSPKTYVTTQSGSYENQLWAIEGEEDGEKYDYNSFAYGDKLVIRPGYTINTVKNKKGPYFSNIKYSTIDIQRSGDKVGKLLINYFDTSIADIDAARRQFTGNGVIEYHTSYLMGNVNTNAFKNADFSSFMSNPDSYFIFHNEKPEKLLNEDIMVFSTFLSIRHLCNTTFKGGYMQVSGIEKDLFMGDVDIQTDMEFFGDDIEFAKDVIVAKGSTLVFSDSGHYTIKGNLVNNGTIIVKDGAILDFQGDVQNNGKMELESVCFSGDKDTFVRGAQIKYGKIVVDKSPKSSVTLVSTVSSLNLDILRGEIHLPKSQYNTIDISLVNGRIYPKGVLHLSNKKTVFNKSIICLGEISVDNSASVSLGDNTLFYQGEYSTININDEASISAKSLEAYTMEGATPEITLRDRGVLNISSNFNLKGGTLSMDVKSKIIIHEDGEIVYNAKTICNAPNSAIYISSGNRVFVTTGTPMPNLVVSNNSEAVARTSSMKILGDLLVEEGATLDMTDANYDLSVGGNVNILGDYIHNQNSTIFNGELPQQVNIESGVIGNLFSEAYLVNVNCGLTVLGNTYIKSGSLNLSRDIELLGESVRVDAGGHLCGEGNLILCADDSQTLFMEGIVDNMVINNTQGVVSTALQREPIKVGRRLVLQRGVLDIGSNILELMPKSIIDGDDFSKTCYIRASSEGTIAGVKVDLDAEESRSVFLPIGTVSDYIPVLLTDITSSTTGAIIIAPYNSVQHVNILPECWLIKSESTNLISGGVTLYSYGEKGEVSKLLCCHFDSTTSSTFDSVNWREGVYSTQIDICEFQQESAIDGMYAFATQDIPYYKVVSKHAIASMKSFTTDDWHIMDSNGNMVSEFPSDEALFSLEVNHDVAFASDFDDADKISFISSYIKRGVTLNLNRVPHLNLGYLSGQGTIKMESAEAEPIGVFDDFSSSQGGVFEYSGSDDYEIMRQIRSFNNVVISGSGTKTIANGERYLNGYLKLTSKGLPMVLIECSPSADDCRVHLNGDLIIDDQATAELLSVSMEGDVCQHITSSSNAPISISSLMVNNRQGVEVDSELLVDHLYLTDGILDMGGGVLTVSEDVTCEDSRLSYVVGKMRRYLQAGEETTYNIGDKEHTGTMYIQSEKDGLWQAEYHHRPYRDVDNITRYAISHSYWEVLSLSAPADKGRVRLTYDNLSGGISSHSKIMMLENGAEGRYWSPVSTTNPTGYKGEGSLLSSYITGVDVTDGESPLVYSLGEASIDNYYIWTGAEDEEWANGNNWQGGIVPTSTSEVYIKESPNNPMVTEKGATAANITIAENATLSLLGKNASINVLGSIYNYGDLDLYYLYSTIPQLEYRGVIFDNDGRNKPNIYRSFMRGRTYYIGSATREGSFSNLLSLNSAGGDILHQYDTEKRSFLSVDRLYGESIAQQAGSIVLNYKQHTSNGRNDNYVIQQGAPVRGTLQTTASLRRGWHWLANPYPFSVNIKGFVEILRGCAAPTIYVRGYRREGDSEGYLFYTYNLSEGVSAAGNEEEKIDALAPFEAFAVFVEEDGTVLALNPLKRAEGVSSLKSSSLAPEQSNILRLTIGSGFHKDELVLVFKKGGSVKKQLADSYKYASQPRASYQIYTTKDGARCAIAIMPQIERYTNQDIPITVSPSQGDMTMPIISVSNISEFATGYDVLLLDRYTGNTINMRTSPYYDIPDVDKLYENRFAIRIEKIEEDREEDKATSIEKVDDDGEVTILSEGMNIQVTSRGDNLLDIMVYDVTGRVVRRVKRYGEATLKMPQEGIFIVRVACAGEQTHKKVRVWRNSI